MIDYPEEVLDRTVDNGTMPASLDRLRSAVVGHRIVSVERVGPFSWADCASTTSSLSGTPTSGPPPSPGAE